MYSRHTTPPQAMAQFYPESVSSQASNASYTMSPEASPDTTITTPARSPIRQLGPVLLPKIRSQDQTTEPTNGPVNGPTSGPIRGPVRHRRTVSAASGFSAGNYSPYMRPGMSRRSTSPIDSNGSVYTPASRLSPFDAGMHSGYNSPNPYSEAPCRPSLHSRSRSTSAVNAHSRSTSVSSIDSSVINRYGYPTYRAMPNYMTAHSTAASMALNMVTAMPTCNEYTNDFQVPDMFEPLHAAAPAVQYPMAADFQFGCDSFGQPATTTIMDYLTAPNPQPALVQRITTAGRSLNQTHYWWDIRNLRSWADFNVETISSIPGLMPLLQIPVAEAALPTPARPNLAPDCEAALHDVYRDYHATKVNAALSVAQGTSHISIRSRKNMPTAQTPVDFVSNYATDYEKTIYGDGRGRVVGIVKAYDQWNTGMRSETPNKQVYYLAGLAHLHRVMREHGCRYGFIMTEIEMLCVRCGGDPATATQVDTATVNADAGSGVPLFGHLELSAPISVSAFGTKTDPVTGEQMPQMTVGLALWYLHMLAKEDPLPGTQGTWRMEVGGPAALTRQHCQEKDAWIPKPNLSEKREAKRVRGWVFPEEPLSRKECGKGKRSKK
ncbi:uncharacterized protein K452DRAFT_244902 [Aplosporella prunicola CBS 121167]|uniref:Sialidase n=1 Tax=Aplosporella prunicola CBS 121167 TaxID=1176127 RepID=A0A6A6BM15_9PEZI|nr:uncharacterized protein K452DRAFT_244902 [Aplosporella prunicola CBS 121167]KAF2145180.1 hypothetical protein K452DRAFT_244902 [Aplosporella prunicola CBS 121167]